MNRKGGILIPDGPVEYECEKENVMPIEKEQVNHPSHYNVPGRKECIEEMIDIWGVENTALWCEMTAYKYQYRKGEKDGNPMEQEIGKIQWYLSKAAELRGLK